MTVLRSKVSNLGSLVDASKYPLLAISDSDMRVDPQYLRTVASAFEGMHPPYGGRQDRSIG